MDFFKKLFGGFSAPSAIGGLDIGTSSIKMVELSKTNTGYKMERYTEGPTPAMTLKDGLVTDPGALADALKDLLANSQMTMDKAVGAVTGRSVVIRPIMMTQMKRHEMQNAIRFEAERYLPYSVSEAVVRGSVLRPEVEGEESMMEVLLVAAPNEMVNGIQDVISLSGITPKYIDLEPSALSRAIMANLSDEVKKQTISLINLGASFSSINIFKDGLLRHNRSISIAGNSFTKAIGQSLNLSFEEAEKLKKEKGIIRVEKDATPVAPTTMRIFNVILPVLNDLMTEIQRSFDYYRSRYSGESVDFVVISGGTSKFKNIDEYMANELGIPCGLANPLVNIDITDVPGYTPEELQEKAPTMMAVLGLALWQFE
ncbi:MAG: type IV pilus assembly protein PilM [Vulcanimicrobiota bacterium]